jgi:hypothetical protein
MPVKITKVKGGFRVSTPNMVHAKKTSLRNAKRQERILNMVEHGVKLKKKVKAKRK